MQNVLVTFQKFSPFPSLAETVFCLFGFARAPLVKIPRESSPLSDLLWGWLPASTTLKCYYFQCSDQFLAPADSVPLRLVLAVIPCIHLSLQIPRKQFALRSQFSDESKKSHWFFSLFISSLPMMMSIMTSDLRSRRTKTGLGDILAIS